jgi:nucleoid-associated protein YgaU
LKFNLKKFLKTLKLNESTISMVLGAIVIVVTGILIVSYFKEKNSSGVISDKGEISENEFGKNHTVIKGESLWSIAEEETGSGYNWTVIANENNLTNPGVITEGQMLAIPTITQTQETTDIILEDVEDMSISGATYQVVKGDNLWNIALRAYGDGYQWIEIARENHLDNPSLIHAGNILALPR